MNPRFRLLFLAMIVTLALGPAFGSEEPAETRRQMLESFNQAYTEADFIEAIRWGLELEKLQPEETLHQYNLACVYALVGNNQTAIAWLRRSVGNGFRKIALLESDTDLKNLRDHPQWPGILARIRENIAAYQSSVREAFFRAPPDVILPPNFDPKTAAPLIIALHGYGGRPEGYPTYWRPAAGKIGAILAIPQGLQRLGRSFFWGDLEETEIVVQLTIELVKSLHLIDESRIVLTGFSQGGSMAMALGVGHPDVFVGVIPMAGRYIERLDRPADAPLGAPRYFFMVGSQDEGKSQNRKAAEDFEAAGYTVDLRVYPGVGHTFPKFTNRELGKALDFVLE